MRRVLDLTLATIGLVLSAPVILVAALFIKLGSPGPVFHRAVRIGLGGEPFTLFKLRTMIVGAPALGPGITAGDDPRITKVGRVLRKWKLDELPQLLNVIRGDMSLVGPRPEDRRYVETYTPQQRRILDFRPGITGPASVYYRDEEAVLAAADDLDAAYERVMAEKIEIDLAYLENRTIRGDLALLWKTISAVLQR